MGAPKSENNGAHIFPVSVAGKTFGVRCQTDPEKRNFWQHVLRQAREDGSDIHCQCRSESALPLVAHKRNGQIHLQAHRFSGAGHHPRCRFHSDSEPAGAVRKLNLSLEVPEARLPAALRSQKGSPASPLSGASSVPTTMLTLDDLLSELWSVAGLDEWHESWAGKRTLFSALNRLRTGAETVELDGAPLSANLVLGGLSQGDRVVESVRTRVERAKGAGRRVLVAGKLVEVKADEELQRSMRFRNFYGLPFFFVPKALGQEVAERNAAVIEHWQAKRPVFAMALIEPGRDRAWFAVSVAVAAVDDRFLRVA